ncbi:lisH domain-containing protein ARMC9-like [Copidosoma floridanum]|uniref:lisH domain-containing protein ARMC9-like n=1 Tax=Copidosoma floridanum TaxID=29053 RepID=UPI0006C963C6|nr:lisH domain-containing protein ARMC9-like [Copidosoma floridanum]
MWDVYFSDDFEKTVTYQVMTLKLRVHFAILPIRIIDLHQHISCRFHESSEVSKILENAAHRFSLTNCEMLKDVDGEERKDSMKQLEEFLNSCDGQKLARISKCSSTLFALPYISNPFEDESMKNIFSIEWVENLIKDLEKFVIDQKQTALRENELTSTKEKLFKVYKHYKKLRFKFHQLHEDYQKINKIAEELTVALESSVQGQPVHFDTIMQTCLKIFPDRFHREVQTDSEDTSIDLQEETIKDIFIKNEKTNTDQILVPAKLLDYKKIKLHLQCESVRVKGLLLQALRQKITLNSLEHRNDTISEYVNNDLLGICGNLSDSNESDLLSRILQPIDSGDNQNFIQQCTARLLNAVVSLKIGRNYLTSSPIALNAIIKYLDSKPGDSITLNMLLGTLQKMSLRKQQRNYMVEANLVEWLVHHLNDEDFRKDAYRLEYACALLMNLSLRSEARLRASLIAPLLVSTMITLLSLDHASILPYVNGALQNFLLNNEVNEEAKKFHFEKILEYRCTKSTDDTRNHFSHTLRIHRRKSEECLSDDDELSDEDDEIFDVLEKQLEENDPVRVEADEFQGDQLLALSYALSAFLLQSTDFFHEKVEQKSTVRSFSCCTDVCCNSFRESKMAYL